MTVAPPGRFSKPRILAVLRISRAETGFLLPAPHRPSAPSSSGVLQTCYSIESNIQADGNESTNGHRTDSVPFERGSGN